MIVKEISAELKAMMPNVKFITDTTEIETMVKNLVGSGIGAGSLKQGDRIIGVHGVTVIETKITGQAQPVKYLALVVRVRATDGKETDKAVSFAAITRRKPGATENHGIFAEEQFKNCVNYQEVYDVLVRNPNFSVTEILRNQEFPTFKATVYVTGR